MSNTYSTDTASQTEAPLTQAVDNDTKAAQELSKPEDVTAYVEDRQEQEKAEASTQEAEPPQQKRASRYERLKRARDQYRAEAEELRKRLGVEPTQESAQQQDLYEAERQQAEFAQQMAARDQMIADQAAFRARAEAIAPQFPDFQETIESVVGIYDPPPELCQMIMKSPFGVEIAYALAKDAWHENSQGVLEHFETLRGDPIAQAREFGRMEEAFKMAAQQRAATAHQPHQTRVTQAPPPMRPVTGGSGGPRDFHALARSDDASDYIRARRSGESR
jgi:hypothetical protein